MDAERPDLHIVDPPKIPEITRNDVRHFFGDYLVAQVSPYPDSPIREEARTLIAEFSHLKEQYFNGEPDLSQKETWIVRATTWDQLAAIARDMLEIAVETSQGTDRKKSEALAKADKAVFCWARIVQVFEA